MSRTRIIKFYSNNRKLYDTYKARYVSLKDLGKILMKGDDIKVIEYGGIENIGNEKDITKQVLIKALMPQVEKSYMQLELGTVKDFFIEGYVR